jgi:alkylhydroperoxidase family enzyme
MFLTEPPTSPVVEATYDEDRAGNGYIQNLTRLWCWRPDVFKAFIESRALLIRESELSARDVAVLVAATVAARSDSYCALAWGARLAVQTDDQTASQVVAGSVVGLDPRGAVLAAWARQVAQAPNSTTAADVERLHAVGMTDGEIFDATALIALRLAFATVNDALGAQPDLQLAAAAPTSVRAAVSYGRPPSEVPSTSLSNATS